MKLSELRKRVDAALEDAGDIDIVTCTEVDGQFCIEYDRAADIIVLEGETVPVFAILPSGYDSDDGPYLKAVK